MVGKAGLTYLGVKGGAKKALQRKNTDRDEQV
jgi:hypothetical protein